MSFKTKLNSELSVSTTISTTSAVTSSVVRLTDIMTPEVKRDDRSYVRIIRTNQHIYMYVCKQTQVSHHQIVSTTPSMSSTAQYRAGVPYCSPESLYVVQEAAFLALLWHSNILRRWTQRERSSRASCGIRLATLHDIATLVENGLESRHSRWYQYKCVMIRRREQLNHFRQAGDSLLFPM